MTDNSLTQLEEVLNSRKSASPDQSYVASLYAKGLDHILKKVGEECSEVIITAKGSVPSELIHEMADLWFHCMVLLTHKNLSFQDVIKELETRFGISGLEEKANRTID